jgi:hypothetical protein
MVDLQISMNFFFASFGKSGSCSNFTVHPRQLVHLFGGGNCPIKSAPNFICILGNDGISHLVPRLDHVDLVFVGNEVRVSSVDIAIGWNIEQRSISKLSSTFFGLCREEIAVSRDNIEASLGKEVLLGSFVEGNVFLQIGGLKFVVGICREQSHFLN